MLTYGTATFLSNTSVTSAQSYQGSNAVKVAANIFDTVIPVHVRDRSLLKKFEQPSSVGMLRDTAFVLYQVNILFGMGIVGGPVVAWLLLRQGAQFRSHAVVRERAWLIPKRCALELHQHAGTLH